MNWDRVLELRDEVGEDALDEVLEVFLMETDEIAARLHTSPDPETLEADMHFMKGAALNLGFDELAAACQDGETRARAGAPGSVDVPAVLACYARSRAELLDGGAAHGIVLSSVA